MKLKIRHLVPVLVIVLSGCAIGQTPRRIASLPRGEGISVTLTSTSTAVARYFEVLAATDEGLYLRTLQSRADDPLQWIAYTHVGKARFERLPQLNFGDGNVPDRDRLGQIRLMSRYPQGIDAELRRALLRAYDQDEIVTLD